MPKVIIADDEEYVRSFLNSLLTTLDFDIAAEVEDGGKLLDAMNQHQPDILMLDINMPNLTGIEFLKLYASKFPKTCIIILTSAALTTLIGEDSLALAQCFLRKDTPVEEIINSIKNAWEEFRISKKI